MLSGSFTNAQFTKVANWQGVDDTPTVDSDNLVKSGGVYVDIMKNKKETIGLMYNYTTNDIINPFIKEIFIEGYTFVGVPKIGFYRYVDSTIDVTIQIFDGDTIVATKYIFNTAAKDAETKYILTESSSSGCTGYVVCNPKELGAISTLNSQKGNENYNGLWYDNALSLNERLVKCESKVTVINNVSVSDVLNNVVKGLYIKTLDDGLTARFYIDGTWKVFQVFKNNDVIAQIPYSTDNSDSIIGNKAGTMYAEFGDLSSILTTSELYSLNSNVKEISSYPTIATYINSNPVAIGSNNINYHVKELFVNTIFTSLKLKFYVDGTWKVLQVYKSDGTTLIEQYKATSDGIVRGMNLGGLAYIVNSDTIVTTSLYSSYDKINDIETQPILNNYNNKLFVVKSGSDTPYNTILKGVLAATQLEGATVLVESGLYNIEVEFKDYYGSDFFTNFTQSSVRGIFLKNGVHVKFSPNAVVNFNYQGDNAYVKELFSPFNTGKGGCTIEGLYLSAKNCRYCIHDDRGTDADYYINNYVNCHLYLDNRGNTAWNSRFCIGGGFGVNGNINIKGCVFESEATGVNTNGLVLYHNSGSDSAKSQLHLENSYFKNDGTFRLTYYGTSTKISQAIVCGNSFGSNIEQAGEGGSTNINTELIEWNNVVR